MNKKKIVVVVGLLTLFVVLMILVLLNKISWFDNFLYAEVRRLECGFSDKFFVLITKLCNFKTVAVMLLLLIALFRNRDGLLLSILSINCALTNVIIKNIIQRDRPSVLRLINQGGYSFPSGHAMIAVAIYGFLLYLVVKKVTNRYLKYSLVTLLGLLILAVGVSRIYVGVHYASDVLAGFSLSLAQLILIINFAETKTRGNENV